MSELEFAVPVLTDVAILTFCLAIKRICKRIIRRNRHMTIDTDSALHTHISDGTGYSMKNY